MRFGRYLVLSVLFTSVLLSGGARADDAGAATPESDLQLFVIEIKVGPKWDSAKPPTKDWWS